jgi:hypothetical protein
MAVKHRGAYNSDRNAYFNNAFLAYNQGYQIPQDVRKMSINQLQEVARLARKGQISHAYELAQQITTREPENFQAWMWLAYMAQTDNEKRSALRRALNLRPGDTSIRDALRSLMTPAYIQQAARSGIFIAYARADELFAVDLADSLRAGGIRAWLDMTEINLETTWHGSITRALMQSGVMLLILSPEALNSKEVTSERNWFLQTGKIVLPVLHKTCDYEALNLMIPAVDFREGFAQGAQQLIRLLTLDEAVK